jgi:hypothetical protein
MEGEEDTPLTVGILFSLDRCLLMGAPGSLPAEGDSLSSEIKCQRHISAFFTGMLIC